MRLVARFIFTTLPYEQVARFAKRHGLQSPKDQHDWHVVEKARGLYKVTATAELARLILEAILIGSAANIHADKENDLLIDAAALYSMDMKAVRAAFEKEEKKRTEKKANSKTKSTARKAKAAAKQ
jgi:2-hydroxychromene-2-carboxylate isomerase